MHHPSSVVLDVSLEGSLPKRLYIFLYILSSCALLLWRVHRSPVGVPAPAYIPVDVTNPDANNERAPRLAAVDAARRFLPVAAQRNGTTFALWPFCTCEAIVLVMRPPFQSVRLSAAHTCAAAALCNTLDMQTAVHSRAQPGLFVKAGEDSEKEREKRLS